MAAGAHGLYIQYLQRGRAYWSRNHRGQAAGGGDAMIPIVRDPNHWRERAKEARALALKIADPESRTRMFGIADEYEKLAQRGRLISV